MDTSQDADFQLARIRFRKLYKKAKLLGISDKDIAKIEFVKKYRPTSKNLLRIIFKWIIISLLAVILLAAGLYAAVIKGMIEARSIAEWSTLFFDIDLNTDNCIIPLHDAVLDFFRPPIDCEFCEGITAFDRVENLHPDEFVKKYAYSGRPVIITDAMKNWTAVEHFNFDFFRNLYGKNSPVFNPDKGKDCQFFPYKTSFQGLKEVFRMPRDMVEMKGKPWYIGWSNCDPEVANKLRAYYRRPYFLSREMESSQTDWIFMGTPGYGAHMHIDSVEHSSWQAQVHGNKTWTLRPPPECYYKCVGFSDTVHAGEVIVLDTNRWFHGTNVVGDRLSIVIGSEYD